MLSKILQEQDCDQTNNLLENSTEEPSPDDDRTSEISGVSESNSEPSKRLFTFKEAPEYIKHNTYILTGYRGILSTALCLER